MFSIHIYIYIQFFLERSPSKFGLTRPAAVVAGMDKHKSRRTNGFSESKKERNRFFAFAEYYRYIYIESDRLSEPLLNACVFCRPAGRKTHSEDLMAAKHPKSLLNTFNLVLDFGYNSYESMCKSMQKGWPRTVYDPMGGHVSVEELYQQNQDGRPYWGVSGGGGAGAGFEIFCSSIAIYRCCMVTCGQAPYRGGVLGAFHLAGSREASA